MVLTHIFWVYELLKYKLCHVNDVYTEKLKIGLYKLKSVWYVTDKFQDLSNLKYTCSNLLYSQIKALQY